MNFNQALTGLIGGVTYHFRAVASNSLGVARGTNQSFATSLFTAVPPAFQGVLDCRAAWADYNSDGLLDISFSGGHTNLPGPARNMARNLGSAFGNQSIVFSSGSADMSWGDANNDNRPDLLSWPYLNWNALPNSPDFLYTNLMITGNGIWTQFDEDGRSDLLVGDGSAELWTLRNTGSGFVIVTNQAALGVAKMASGDYDRDGRVDLLLHRLESDVPFVEVWRNTGNGFSNINAGLPGFFLPAMAWGDYDNDGLLDILVCGFTNRILFGVAGHVTRGFSQVWRNTGTGFTNINAELTGLLGDGAAAWGDYDNDGRLDILLAGLTNFASSNVSQPVTELWRNNGSGFSKVPVTLPGVTDAAVAWADYDNDGRLDLFLAGATQFVTNPPIYRGFIAQVWRNNTPLTNSPPTAPANLAVSANASRLIFSWNASSDAQTPANCLTYNLRVGTTPGGSDLLSPLSLNSGRRQLPGVGNAGRQLSFALSGLPLNQTIYWSVQSIDSAFAGSAFSAESSFALQAVVTQPGSPNPLPGDENGDGIVSQAEFAAVLANLNGNGIMTESNLNLVLSNYFAHSPWLQMTNVAGLGGTNVTFALTNNLTGAFAVEYSTNLLDWLFLGPATPRYLFTDTNAPANLQRYYRLRWP